MTTSANFNLAIPGRVTATAVDDSRSSNKLGAANDAHAVELWLSQHTVGTRREYARHAKRFLAWLGSVHLSLDGCSFEHLGKYFDQLDEPALLIKHIELFVPVERQSEFKRLFSVEGKPTPGRATRSRKIIVALFRWLQLSGYVSTIAIPKVVDGPSGTEEPHNSTERQREQLAKRVLADHQWAVVDTAIQNLNWQNELQARCRAIAVWLRESGARRQELAAARLDAMQRHSVESDTTPVWLWRIRGKGNKVRYVAVTPAMIDAFKRYRLAQGIPFFEDDPFLAPRIAGRGDESDSYLFYGVYGTATLGDESAQVVRQHRRRSGARSISSTTIYNDIKALANAAAAMCNAEADRVRVRELSPHWFRHRRALELTKRLTTLQVAQYLGHKSIETTKAYSFDDELDLAKVVLAASVS